MIDDSSTNEAPQVWSDDLSNQTSPLEPVATPSAEPVASPYVAAEAYAPTPPPSTGGYAAAGAGVGEYAADAGSPAAAPTNAASEQRSSSGLRRALLIGGATAAALLVLGLCVLAAIFAFGMFGSKPPATTTAGTISNTVPVASAGATTGTASSQAAVTTATPGLTSAESVAIVTNADVYAVRDPFEPLLKALPTATTSSSSTSSTSTSSGSKSTTSTSGGSSSSSSKEDSSTLTLVSISTKDGVRVANLTLGGTEYALSAGQQVGDTPWQVLSVESDYVVMLYGDEQITLTPGQGVSK
jgi:hypothetical protein